MRPPKTLAFAAGLTAWIGCVVAGFVALQDYAATPGAERPPGKNAAAVVTKYQHKNHGLVVMAVHPLCPCTDASLSELGDLLARSHGQCDAVILEYRPATPPSDWPDGETTHTLGGVVVPVLIDVGGKMAVELGAQTSGHVVFIDSAGVLRFHGGITIARGHRGRSPAQDGILAALQGSAVPISTAPVFGCALEPECKPEATQ